MNDTKVLFSALLEEMNGLEIETAKYLNTINTTSDSIFNDSNQSKKFYKQEYKLFSIALLKIISKCEDNMSRLSSIIETEDKNCNTQEVEMLTHKFNNYIDFSKQLSVFIQENELLIYSENSFSKTDTVNSAKKLLGAINTFKNNLTVDI